MRRSRVFVTGALVLAGLLTQQTSAQPGPIRVACIGNSITYGGLGDLSYPQQLGKLLGAHYEVKNFGVGGRTMLKKGDYPYWNEQAFYDAQDYNPQIIILCLGTNDSKPWNWVYRGDFYRDYMEFVATFRKEHRNPQFYVCFPPPAFQDNFGITNAVIRDEIIPLVDSVRATARTLRIDFYQGMSPYGSLFPDGIHPNADGYAIMAQIADTAILTSPPGFIRYFIPSVPSFEKGQSVSLYWEATAGSTVTLDDAPVSSLDSTVVQPAGTTAYTLIAGGTEFSDTNTLTLNYVAPGTIKTFTAEPPILDLGVGDSSILRWTTARGSTVLLDGQPVEPNGSASVAPTATTTYTLVGSGEITDSAFATVLLLPSEQINRALNKPVQASSTQYGSPSQEAVDGDTSTAWRSKSGASQWILVNLGKSRPLTRVVLKWGAAFGTSYTVQGLDSAGVPKNLFTTSVGDGGVDDIDTLHGVGKYLRLILTRKNLADSGYVLREMEVYSAPATSSVDRANEPIGGYVLEQNYPNPFNPTTGIGYQVSGVSDVRLSVYDVLGREVAVLVNEVQQPGTYSVEFDGSKLASGVYVYRLSAGRFVECRKMILMK